MKHLNIIDEGNSQNIGESSFSIQEINTGDCHLKEKQLIHIINQNSVNLNLPPENVVNGICIYLINKNLIPIGDITQEITQILVFLEKLNTITKGINFYKSNAFKYIYEGSNLTELLQQILDNATFWINKFNMDFFAGYNGKSKERKTLMRSDIDDDFYLSMKPGSGVGTFALDFAIGIKGKDFNLNVPTREIWRTGIDTQKINTHNTVRIIRTGGALKKSNSNYEEKSQMYDLFKKRYGLSPQRALVFLSMYVAKDLDGGADLKAISLEGARQKKLSLVKSSRINFDYTQLFKSVGFEETDNKNWLSIGNIDKGFYDALETSAKNTNGLRAYETTGMDNILNTFRKLQDVFDSEIKCPLTVCKDWTKDEIEQVINTFKIIHHK